MAKAKYNGLIHGHSGQLLAVSNNTDYLHGLARERYLGEYEIVSGLKAIQQVTQLYNIDTAIRSNRYTLKQIKDKYRHWE
jgi:hypothetical protein